MLEARVGIEPTHKGFADLSLTAWVPRPEHEILRQKGTLGPARSALVVNWSGRRDLNPRPSPWQGDALPLSYSRMVLYEYNGRLRSGSTHTFGVVDTDRDNFVG